MINKMINKIKPPDTYTTPPLLCLLTSLFIERNSFRNSFLSAELNEDLSIALISFTRLISAFTLAASVSVEESEVGFFSAAFYFSRGKNTVKGCVNVATEKAFFDDSFFEKTRRAGLLTMPAFKKLQQRKAW